MASANLLLLVNYRPEYRHEWGQKTYYTQLRLAPLGQAEADELLTFLLGSDASLTALKSLIMEQTEGTPFFMEEVVQTLVEEGALTGERGTYQLETTPTELHLSPTVQGVLAARIDRLATAEKALLQHLAVVGRQFPVSLIQHVVAQPEADLFRLLSSLQAKEFLYEQPAFPEVEYLFKHALTQEVAYGTVLQEQRKALHERTGQAVEALYADTLEDHYSELAYHYQQSGNAKKAVEYLHLAGQQAIQRSAHEEAIRNLSTALKLLKSWPATPHRDQQELDLQIALGVPLITTRGYGAPEVEHAYSRARALCPREGESAQLFPILWGLWICYAVQGEFTTAHELAEQGMQLAERLHDPALLLQAHYMVGVTAFHTAPLPRAREHLEQLLAIYDPEQHSGNAFDYGQDPGVTGLCILGETLRLLGYPDQARARMQAGFTLAQTLAHPFSFSFTLGWNTSHAAYRGEGTAAQDWAERAVAFPTEHRFEYQIGFNTILQGWVRAKQGQVGEGLRQLREGLTRYQATGAKMALPSCFAWLTEAYIQGDQRAAGLATVAEGLALVDHTGERVYEAELYRLQGELLLAQGPSPSAGRGSRFSARPDRRPPAGSQVLGTPRGHESRAPVATAREEGGSPRAARPSLLLVYRRV